MIMHQKHIFLTRINDIDVLVSQEKLVFLPFLELMFTHQFGQTQIHIVISAFLMIGHHKFILLIGVIELMLWFYKKNLPFCYF